MKLNFKKTQCWMMKIKKIKKEQTNGLNQSGLSYQTHNPGHKIEITQ
jgi:hypothetical protein